MGVVSSQPHSNKHVARIASEVSAEVDRGVLALNLFGVEPSTVLVRAMYDRALTESLTSFFIEFDPLGLAPAIEHQKYRCRVISHLE